MLSYVHVALEVAIKVIPSNTTDTEADSESTGQTEKEVVNDSIVMRVCKNILYYVLPAMNGFIFSGCPRSLCGHRRQTTRVCTPD